MAGRPSSIDAVIAYTEDQTPITVSDRIIASLRTGSFFEPAVLATGVGKSTAYGWLTVAGKAQLREAGRAKPKYTAHEERCIAFSDAVREAESLYEVNENARLDRVARGGAKTTVTTTKYDSQGNVIETTVRESEAEPNPQVIEWRLTRRFPERYRESIEVRNPGELSIEERARALVENLTQYVHDQAEPSPNGKDH